MKSIVLALSALALVAGPAVAQTAMTPDGAAAPEKPVKTKKPRRICRNVPVTGSRLGDSVCKTADEWAQIDKTQQDSNTSLSSNRFYSGH